MWSSLATITFLHLEHVQGFWFLPDISGCLQSPHLSREGSFSGNRVVLYPASRRNQSGKFFRWSRHPRSLYCTVDDSFCKYWFLRGMPVEHLDQLARKTDGNSVLFTPWYKSGISVTRTISYTCLKSVVSTSEPAVDDCVTLFQLRLSLPAWSFRL